jgi:hypothetical protein
MKITRIENVKEGTGVKREGSPGTLTLRCDRPLHKSGHKWWSAGWNVPRDYTEVLAVMPSEVLGLAVLDDYLLAVCEDGIYGVSQSGEIFDIGVDRKPATTVDSELRALEHGLKQAAAKANG